LLLNDAISTLNLPAASPMKEPPDGRWQRTLQRRAEVTSSDTYPTLPFPRADILDIAEENRTLRAGGQLSRVLTRAGDPAWLVTGYDAALQLFGDDRLGRSHPDPANASQISKSVFFGGPRGDYETEADTHRRMRRLLAPAFSARRMHRLGQQIQNLVDDLLDRMASCTPPVDFHEWLSRPLPFMVICELLGIPYEDHRVLEEWEEDFTDLTDEVGNVAAHHKLVGYMRGVVERKHRQPADDVISYLVANADKAGFDHDYIAQIAASVMHGGHRNTVTRIDLGMLLFFVHSEQRKLLQNDPSLAGSAVEEILRIAAPADHGLPRYARADIEVQGVTIRKGDAILLFPEVANRDTDAFPDADRFDILRAGEKSHLGFGHGPHYCPGAGLARAELHALFGTVFQRFPTLRLAVPRSELHHKLDNQTGGLVSLPVTW
jgi:pentalenolactone synthase